MKIYVASSWRNAYQPQVVDALRKEGNEVYDFRNPAEGDNGFLVSTFALGLSPSRRGRGVVVTPSGRDG